MNTNKVIEMNHKERLEVAGMLAKKAVEKYGNNILFVGLYGSVARNEDKKFSDIEMFAVTKQKKKYPYVSFVYKGIPVYLEFLSKKEILKRIKNVDVSWSAEVGKFLEPLKIYGSEKTVKEFREVVSKLPNGKFKEALYHSFLDMVERFNRLRNDYEDRNLVMIREAADWFVWTVNMTVGLLNRRWYLRNGIKRWIEAREFETKPRKYESLIAKLNEGKPVEEIFGATQELFEECRQLVSKRNVKIKEFANLSQVKIK